MISVKPVYRYSTETGKATTVQTGGLSREVETKTGLTEFNTKLWNAQCGFCHNSRLENT